MESSAAPLYICIIISFLFTQPELSWTLTFPYRDRLSEQNDHGSNDEVVIPPKIAPQIARVHPKSDKDE
jgi:hypothetical protein